MVSTRSKKNLPASPTPTARSGRPPTTPRSTKSTRQRSAVGSTGSAARKLGSAADSDDDIIFSDSESFQPFKKPATLKSAVSVRSESSTGSRSSLPLNVEKALLQDITKTGGISLYDAGKAQGLCVLLDSNKEFFGARGDNIQTRIGQRVKYLKGLPDDKYRKVLKRVQVRVTKAKAAASAPPSAIKTKGREDELSDLENDPQEDDDAEDDTVPDIVQSSATKANKSGLSSPTPVNLRSVSSTGTPRPKVALSSPTPVAVRSASILTPSSSRGPAPLVTMATIDNSK